MFVVKTYSIQPCVCCSLTGNEGTFLYDFLVILNGLMSPHISVMCELKHQKIHCQDHSYNNRAV